jgi:hypothetical protein
MSDCDYNRRSKIAFSPKLGIAREISAPTWKVRQRLPAFLDLERKFQFFKAADANSAA